MLAITDGATFEDSAFHLTERGSILEAWRFICAHKIYVKFDSFTVNNSTGRRHW